MVMTVMIVMMTMQVNTAMPARLPSVGEDVDVDALQGGSMNYDL